MEGQLWPAEREFLKRAVIAAAPKLVFEIGTWKGGGSTLVIATALEMTRSGILYTCETNTNFYFEAKEIYDNARWRGIVHCHNMPSQELIRHLIDSGRVPDFVFSDGSEDPTVPLAELQMLEPHMRSGSLFCMHDWDPYEREAGVVSAKATLVRPYMEQSPQWNIIQYITRPVSVGMIVAKKV